MKIAPTFWLEFITSVQVVEVVGVQFEDQLTNEEPEFGVAVSVTLVPSGKSPVQPALELQLIPVGLLTTIPMPEPTS